MFENLNIFKISSAMAKHAGARQALISQNVANADTPGYQSKDMVSFKSTYDDAQETFQIATRSKHLHGQATGASFGGARIERNMASPDGNTVSVEREMLKAAETAKQHDRALAIYKSALGIIRSSLGSR